MPYDSLSELPTGVKHVLPPHAQEIYMKAFNNAWDEYEDPANRRGSESRDTVARMVAWAAVKKEFLKDEVTGNWVKKPWVTH